MTPTMWLTLVACVGMATLVIPVARSRHELAAPLGALLADMLVWNLAWLGFQSSGDLRWRFVARTAASLIMALGFDFVLTFVGRRRQLTALRRGTWAFYGLIGASAASRLVTGSDALYLGHDVWRRLVVGGGGATAVVIGGLLIAHYRSHRDRAERVHTRLLMIGLASWLALAATDLVHAHVVERVPQMSAVGMLISAAVMAVVMDRVRPGGPSRWWGLYTVVLFVVAASGSVIVFKTLPTPTAMLFSRTVIVVAVGLAAAREIIVMIVRRRERLAELAMVGRVTEQMAHDLQNPLAALKCAAQILEEDRQRCDGARVVRERRMLDTIVAQTERLSAIVDDYRRVGRVDPRVEPVRLSGLVARTGCPHNVRFETEVAGAPPCLADPELVARAVENLVRNAGEAMPTGGKIAVTARPVGARDGDAAEWVELTVADDGPGMDARTCERALDDFFTTKAQGSGLGLAFVRRVAEAHGGSVRITSRIGHGTSVTLRLPVASPHQLDMTDHVHAAA